MSFSFLRLDKRSQKSENSVNKRWKRTNARQGETSEKEPPISTPKWAISDEWKALLEQREEVEAEGYVNCFMDLTTRKKIGRNTLFLCNVLRKLEMARFIYQL